jgi:transglutaminase-like putative cysteine protease
MSKFFIFLILSVSGIQLSLAEEYADPDTRYKKLHSSYTINEDRTHVEKHERAIKILKERAIERTKKASISYSSSIQKAEVLEAYTIKASGKRIDAPKTNYQVKTNKGKDDNSPVFSDRTYLTVVFPEVSVGDTVVFSYKITQTEPMFPGQFSASRVFPLYYAYDDVRVTVDMPSSFPAKYRARKMSEKITKKGARKIITWSLTNKKPKKNKRRNYSVWDQDAQPGFSISTYKSYEEIAEAYGVRALPKAVVTKRIKKLANKIVGDEKNKREQARLLYEWVATKITYAGHCIGVGAVVPHDLSFILDNQMGDCKDQATLLQALFKSKNIISTQALVNSGSTYKLPAIPLVTAVNHVMNYIPEFDLYVDATARHIPFGMLSRSTQDKPILMVGNFKENLKSPVPDIGSNSLLTKTDINIKSDGSVSGKVDTAMKGQFAVASRAIFRQISPDQMEKLMQNIYNSQGQIGKGSMAKEDPKALKSTYKYSVEFERNKFIKRPGAGAFLISPMFPLNAQMHQAVAAAAETVEIVPVACGSAYLKEEYIYKLPADMKVLALPESLNINGGHLTYSATYTQKENRILITRILDDRTPGSKCSPSLQKKQRAVALKIMEDLKSQIVYK